MQNKGVKMVAKNKDECGCSMVKPKNGELHIVIKAFYEDRIWAADFIFKDDDKKYTRFLERGDWIIKRTAKTLAKEGVLTSMDVI